MQIDFRVETGQINWSKRAVCTKQERTSTSIECNANVASRGSWQSYENIVTRGFVRTRPACTRSWRLHGVLCFTLELEIAVGTVNTLQRSYRWKQSLSAVSIENARNLWKIYREYLKIGIERNPCTGLSNKFFFDFDESFPSITCNETRDTRKTS